MLAASKARWLALFLLLFALTACGAGGDDDDHHAGAPDDDAGDDDQSPGDDDDDNDDESPADEVEVVQDGDTLIIRNAQVEVRYFLTAGRYSVFERGKGAVIDHAAATVSSNVLWPAHIWRSNEMFFAEWSQAEAHNELGDGKTIVVRRAAQTAPDLKQSFTLLSGLGVVLADATAINTTETRLKIGAIYPLDAAPPDAAVRLGRPADWRVLSNGFLNYVDFSVPIYPSASPLISNWSALIYNQVTRRSLFLGFLTFEVAQPVVYVGPELGDAPGTSVQADCEYDPAKTLWPGQHLQSEPLALDFTAATPFAALETYGDRLKAWQHISLWTERHPEIGVPAGWNSWSGGGSSGGYGTNIDEALIVENMDFADRELRRWGMNYFQIDDGWQVAVGDWQVNVDRFPDHGEQNGIAWLLQRAKDLGFQTGLWISAFIAGKDSQIYQDHRDWFATPFLWDLFGESDPTLDLSMPVVQDHLAAVMAEMKDWGIQWLKLDFAYRAILSQGWADNTLTRGEYYREGVRILREALGDDVLLLNVAVAGFNVGLVDSLRLTLDTMPVWEGTAEKPYSPIAAFDNQGLKPMYRDAARRYYLHQRVWINHPDLIFFRSWPGGEYPPLTLDQSTTFATSVALQGGLVKIGDRLAELTTDGVDVLRRLLPVYGKAGRPLDLFQREFPETWVLPVDDFAEPYVVLGLLNWGVNRDLTVTPYAMMDEEARTLSVDFAEAEIDPDKTYLAFEFWTQEFLGEVNGEFALEVPADASRVVTLREKLDRPQLVGQNRHVLGGVRVIQNLTWDATAKTLSGAQEGSIGTELAPFTHQLTFYVPAGFSAAGAQVIAPDGFDIADQALTTDGELATLSFRVVEVDAAKAAAHPTVNWTLACE